MDDKEAEFDKFVDDYNETIVNALGKLGKYRDTAFIYKAQLLRHILENEPKSILDFGCGIGSIIPYLHLYFKNTKLYGCDISSKSIDFAKKNYPYCEFNVVNKIEELEIYKNVDCVFINTVMHHIPQNKHEYWIGGLYDILSDSKTMGGGGGIVIVEHNMRNPITKASVKKSKIDEDAAMLHPNYCKQLLKNNFYDTKIVDKEILLRKDNVKLKYTYFFPWRNKFFTKIEHMLFWLPFGAQYCVYGKK